MSTPASSNKDDTVTKLNCATWTLYRFHPISFELSEIFRCESPKKKPSQFTDLRRKLLVVCNDRKKASLSGRTADATFECIPCTCVHRPFRFNGVYFIISICGRMWNYRMKLLRIRKMLNCQFSPGANRPIEKLVLRVILGVHYPLSLLAER